MAARDDVERSLLRQADQLESVVTNILGRVPWDEWSGEDRQSLVQALNPHGRSAFEQAKARNLARHLFRGDTPVFRSEDTEQETANDPSAERLRADLPGLLPLGSGRYLLGQLTARTQIPEPRPYR